MTDLTLLSVFIAGVVTTLLPCTYPMVIGYVAMFLADKENIFKTTFWFFLGFTIVYVLFGLIATLFGQFSDTVIIFNSIKGYIPIIGGIFFVIIGLILLQKIPLPNFLKKIHSIRFPSWLKINKWWGAFILGAIFATAWSPCIGPVLGGVLLLAATKETIFLGAFLMFVFAIGIMVPMVIISILYLKATNLVKNTEKITRIASILGGFIFIVLGLTFLLGGNFASSYIPDFLLEFV